MKRRNRNRINRLKKLIERTFALRRIIVRRSHVCTRVPRAMRNLRRKLMIMHLILAQNRMKFHHRLMKIAWKHKIRHVGNRRVKVMRCMFALTLDRKWTPTRALVRYKSLISREVFIRGYRISSMLVRAQYRLLLIGDGVRVKRVRYVLIVIPRIYRRNKIRLTLNQIHVNRRNNPTPRFSGLEQLCELTK